MRDKTIFNLLEKEDKEYWKKITKNPNVLAVFLHGSISRGKKEITNDLDILIVLKKAIFSNWANEKLLGFEHIRHKGAFDRYLTDIDHCSLAIEILGEMKCLFKRRGFSISSIFTFSLDYFKNRKTRNEYDFEREIKIKIKSLATQYKGNLDKIKEEFPQEEYPKTFGDSTLISQFWLFIANHSWINFTTKRLEKE